MNNILSRLLFLLVIVIFLPSHNALAQASDNNSSSFERFTCGYYQTAENTLGFTPCWQASLGLGMSQFSPDDESSSWKLKDEKDSAWRISASYRPYRYTWVEIVYADLGAASFENTNTLIQDTAEVSYQAPALFIGGEYPLWFKGTDSLSVIAKIGAGSIATDSSHDLLRNEKDDDIQFAWGVGLQYHFSEHWLVRSDFESFSEDTSLASLSIAYKWGGESKRMYVANRSVVEQPQPIKVTDSDGDGVTDSLDHCVTTQRFVGRVDANGCVKYTGSFVPLLFAHNKSDLNSLSSNGKRVLRHYLSILTAFPDTQVTVAGHTDGFGLSKKNLKVSQQRADVVFQYLKTHGIEESRLTMQAKASASPSLSSDAIGVSAQGLSQRHDRRVELMVNE